MERDIEINYGGIDLFIYYEFIEGEPSTRGVPGTPDTVRLNEVFISGTEWELLNNGVFSAEDEEKIEEIVLEKHLN